MPSTAAEWQMREEAAAALALSSTLCSGVMKVLGSPRLSSWNSFRSLESSPASIW